MAPALLRMRAGVHSMEVPDCAPLHPRYGVKQRSDSSETQLDRRTGRGSLGLAALLTGDNEINPRHADKIARMLARLDEATRPEQLDLPGFRLHQLKGELAGYWSITVRANSADRLPFRAGRCHRC